MRTDQWLCGPAPEADRDPARAELVRRYLHCYGPSTLQHFAEWAGIGLAQAEQAWKPVEGEMVPVDFEGRKTWLHEQDRMRFLSPPTPAGVRFLPPGDPYLTLRDRATLIHDKALHRQIWRQSGNPGVLLADGQFKAIWRPEKKAKRLTLSVESFSSLSQALRSQIEVEAESLALFRGCTSVQIKFTNSNQT